MICFTSTVVSNTTDLQRRGTNFWDTLCIGVFLLFFSSSGDSGTEEVDSCTFEDIVLDETNEGIYLSLGEIAIFLSHLANQGIKIVITELRSYYTSSSEVSLTCGR